MVPDPNYTVLGLEYFCFHDDALWCMEDRDLVAMAAGELAQLGLVDASPIVEGVVVRQQAAYPVYDHE